MCIYIHIDMCGYAYVELNMYTHVLRFLLLTNPESQEETTGLKSPILKTAPSETPNLS